MEKLTKNWWMFGLRGLAAIIFGVLALIWPEQAMQALVLTFGAFALIDGTLAVFAGISSAPYFKRWWAVLLEGVAGIVIGLLTFFWPNVTATALVYFIAAWALITGILEIVAAIQLRREITGEWMLVLGGLLSIGLGVLMFIYPAAGAVSMIWVIGVYAIAFGITEIVLAFRMRSLHQELDTTVA